MAEVTVSVDDEGAASERQEISAPNMPLVAGEQLPPLPSAPQSAPSYGDVRRREAPVTRPIMPDEWVHDEDDYWDTQSMIAVSGRRAVPRPRPRSLEPPQRFQPVRRWQSMVALVVLSVVILAACVGMVQASRFVNNVLHTIHPVPTVTHPTVAPTLAPSPTTKPKHK